MKELRFGTAMREITPAYPVWMYGYADRERKSDSVTEPICLGCLAVSDGERRILIVTCDLIGIQAHVCERLYALLLRETGIGYPNVLLSCSHTHFAPGLHANQSACPRVGITEPDPRFVVEFETKLVEAARESLRNLQPGQLETVRVQVPQVLFNRRSVRADGSVETSFLYPSDPDAYTFSPTDAELTALRFTDETGVKAVLVNFGCHPVTGGQIRERDHYRVSADYPSYLRRVIARRYACPVFFTLGAAGDAVPIDRYGDSRQRIGSVLGNAVVLAERLYTPDGCPELLASFQELDVRTIIETNATVVEEEYERARQAYIAVLADPDPDSDAYRAASETFNRKMTALVRSRLYPDNQYTVKAQILKIGRTVLVGLPFEVLAEIGVRIKEQFPNSILLSCTGGYQGYLPLAYEYERGGYEASERSTHFVPGTGDRLLEAVLDKLDELTS
jgi:hypothetical protein